MLFSVFQLTLEGKLMDIGFTSRFVSTFVLRVSQVSPEVSFMFLTWTFYSKFRQYYWRRIHICFLSAFEWCCSLLIAPHTFSFVFAFLLFLWFIWCLVFCGFFVLCHNWVLYIYFQSIKCNSWFSFVLIFIFNLIYAFYMWLYVLKFKNKNNTIFLKSFLPLLWLNSVIILWTAYSPSSLKVRKSNKILTKKWKKQIFCQTAL